MTGLAAEDQTGWVPPLLEIRLFGTVELRSGGVTLAPLPSTRAQSLLGYLLVHRGAAVPRERLAAELWPESTEAQARTNLRHVLHTLRRSLPHADDHLEVTGSALRWREESPFWLDLAVFEELLGSGPADRRAALTEAVSLAAAPLIEGCDDAWLEAARDRNRAQLLEVLAELAELCEADGSGAEAVAYAERLLRLDPLAESSYRLLDAAALRARRSRPGLAGVPPLQLDPGARAGGRAVPGHARRVRRPPTPGDGRAYAGPSGRPTAAGRP